MPVQLCGAAGLSTVAVAHKEAVEEQVGKKGKSRVAEDGSQLAHVS